MDDPSLRAGTLLGDYRLDRFLAESSSTLTWLAGQASVGRPVLLVELKPAALDRRDAFLADVRAQAAVDHPLVASVFEAVSTPEHCFAALERLPGTSLAERIQAREALKPVQLAHLLRRTAEAALALEAAGTATAPMGPGDIFVDSHGVVRLANLARAGTRDPARSQGDIDRLGQSLPPVVADGHPGASRMLTLLAWMRGEGLDHPLGWAEVRSYAEQIEHQLAESPAAPAPPTAPALPRRVSLPLATLLATVVLGGGTALVALKDRTRRGTDLPLPPPVAIPAGDHPTADGGTTRLDAFTLSAHEVTIGEYQEFLDALAGLPPDQRHAYDHPTQPPEKSGHLPDDWPEIIAATKSGSQWQGRAVTRDCPAVNVDWWDAAAYCEWKGSRLPTHEEWFAALHRQLANPASLRPAGWGPVQEIAPTDRTPAGLHGMAGSVAEWTASRSRNPANPLGEPAWIIAGGSYLKPAAGANSREWTDQLGQRRPDLGFRVVTP
jgi:formylglycine-generating enzyme required for sulfatase activity